MDDTLSPEETDETTDGAPPEPQAPDAPDSPTAKKTARRAPKPAAPPAASAAPTPPANRFQPSLDPPERLANDPAPELTPDLGDIADDYALWLIRNKPEQARAQYAGREHRLCAEARALLA